MLLTILEAQVAPGRERDLQSAFTAAASGPIPRGLVRSELLRDPRDPTRWRIETLWYTRESRETMHAAEPFPLRSHFDWAVRAKERGVCVGRVEATLNPDRRAYLAYMFGVQHWGRGFATEACRRVVEALFEDYGMERITAEVDTPNMGSIRVLEPLGFQRGGIERCDHIFNGAQCYEITYSLRRA